MRGRYSDMLQGSGLQGSGGKLSRTKALSPQQCSKLRGRGITSCKVTTIQFPVQIISWIR